MNNSSGCEINIIKKYMIKLGGLIAIYAHMSILHHTWSVANQKMEVSYC